MLGIFEYILYYSEEVLYKIDKEGEGDCGDGPRQVSERFLWLLNDKVGVEGESNTSEILLQLKIISS